MPAREKLFGVTSGDRTHDRKHHKLERYPLRHGHQKIELHTLKKTGAASWNRTSDACAFNAALYQTELSQQILR